MRIARAGFKCAAVGGVLIVAGGDFDRDTFEVYEQALWGWYRLSRVTVSSFPATLGFRSFLRFSSETR